MALDYFFIGDDFTGASDTLATLAERGLAVRLFLDPPSARAIAEQRLDAVGVATEFRAARPGEIEAGIGTLGPALRSLKPRFVHYKVCSTFDSAAHVGSIGAAAAALRRHLDPALVVVIGGQPSLGRHCAFGTLFARGPDGAIHRIDRHPIMSRHPVTPMGEADLLRHLAAQGLTGLRLEDVRALSADAAALDARLAQDVEEQRAGVLFDAIDDRHVAAVGAALRRLKAGSRPVLAIGASSVAEALFGPERQSAQPSDRRDEPPAAHGGPCFVIAGSRSSLTAAQVRAATLYEPVPIRSADLSAGGRPLLVSRCIERLERGANVLAHLVPDEEYGLAGGELSLRLAAIAGAVLERHRLGALGVAGGDTSSVIVRRLGFESLTFLHRAAPGVAVCATHSQNQELNGLRLLLKGGQVGSTDIFDRFAIPV